MSKTRNRPNPSSERHPLAEPRFGAAAALIGLGGIGIGLILAHTLPFVGLLISLAAALGVISLYFKSLVGIYRLLSNRSVYSSRPRIIEILVAIGMVIVLILISLSLYFAKSSDYFTRARLEFSKMQLMTDLNSRSRWVNVILANAGVLTATNTVLRSGGRLSDHAPISPAEERNEMDRLRTDANSSKPPFYEALPNEQTMETISNLTVTDADLDNFNHRHLALYLFIIAYYDDEAITGKGIGLQRFMDIMRLRLTIGTTVPRSLPGFIELMGLDKG